MRRGAGDGGDDVCWGGVGGDGASGACGDDLCGGGGGAHGVGGGGDDVCAGEGGIFGGGTSLDARGLGGSRSHPRCNPLCMSSPVSPISI